MHDHNERGPFLATPAERPVVNAWAFDLPAMLATLKRNWKVLGVFGAVGFLWALISLHQTAPTYAVEMVVTPVRATEETGGSRLSGLASLAGISVAGINSSTPFALYLESLTSRTVADRLAADESFMHMLFAPLWDAQTQRWMPPATSVASHAVAGVKSLLGYPVMSWHPPDGETIQALLDQELTVTQDPRKSYIATVQLETGDIPQGLAILNKLGRVADQMLREKALRRAKQYREYLIQQLKIVSVAEQREALTNALNDQEQYIMTASAGSVYAADMLDAPHGAATPLAPRPTSTYLRDIVLMMLLGAMLVLAWNAIADRLRDSASRTNGRIRVERLPRFLRRALEL